MKALSVICYIIGTCLLVASCFTSGVALTWWLGGGAVVLLILGCIFQFNVKKRDVDDLINAERNAHFNS
jgi:membrane protein implicated in regulation of membrane protease activity